MQLPPAVELRAAAIRAIHGRAIVERNGDGWLVRAPRPGDPPPEVFGRRDSAEYRAKMTKRLARMRERAGKRGTR